MKNLRINIDEPRDAQKYITRAEHDFSAKLDAITADIVANSDNRIITLAGPTCSGKTTTANKLTERIREAGKNPVVFSIDDFFLDRADRNVVDGDAPDYDSVSAIDLDCLEEFVADLLAGKTVRRPIFDFVNTHRSGYEEYSPNGKDIYVFEGIQAVYPEVTSLFGDYTSIFIRVADDVRYRGSVLLGDEIRLFRRIVRDYKFRGATAEFTLHLWNTVRANEITSIFPNAGNSDYYINSLLRYEPFVLANNVLGLLGTVPKDSKYRDEADLLTDKLKPFENHFFEEKMIPSTSMFREFIG